MNNYCRNCGNKLENNQKICPCGAEVIEKRVNIEEKKQELEKARKVEKKYTTIILGCIIGVWVFAYLIDSLQLKFMSFLPSLCLLIAGITLIYARITCPWSNKIRTIFNVLLISGMIYFTLILLISVSCGYFLIYGCP